MPKIFEITESVEQRQARTRSERRAGLEDRLKDALLRRQRLLEVIAKPGQFTHRRDELQRQHDAPEVGRTFEQQENLRREIHDAAQEAFQAEPDAIIAKAELPGIDAEIANIQSLLAGIEREQFDRKTAELVADLPVAWTNAVLAQEALDEHLQAGRERGYRLPALGVAVEAHPSATRTSKRSEDVKTYLQFLLAQVDSEFAATLSEDSPVRRKLDAAKKGAGVSGLALRWG